LHGALAVARVLADVAEVREEHGVVGIALERLLDERARLREITAAISDEAEQMQRVGIAGIGREDGAVLARGGREVARAVQGHAPLQRRLRGRHWSSSSAHASRRESRARRGVPGESWDSIVTALLHAPRALTARRRESPA
jgi:hypothetical protein